MPKFFENWLRSLSPEQRDAMWHWADEDPHAAWEVIQIVGKPDGMPNSRELTAQS